MQCEKPLTSIRTCISDLSISISFLRGSAKKTSLSDIIFKEHQNVPHLGESHMNKYRNQLQMASVFVVAGLLILTAWGNAIALFWAAAVGLLVLSVWCLLDRKAWLATISAIVFTVTAFCFANSVF